MRYLFLSKMKPLIELLRFLGMIYKQNSEPHEKFHTICAHFGVRSEVIIKINCTVYGIIQLGATWPSIIVIMLTGETILSMRSYLYGFDEDSVVTLAYNNFLVTLNIYIGCLTDAIVFLTFGNYALVSNIIKTELEDFEEKLVAEKMTDKEVQRTLIRVILMYKKYIE